MSILAQLETKLSGIDMSVITDDTFTVCGTGNATHPFYPPECFMMDTSENSLHRHNGLARDVWGLGVTAACCLYGRIPWLEMPKSQFQLQCYTKNLVFIPPADGQLVSDGFTEVLRGMLHIDPEKRWSLEQVLRHSSMAELWPEFETQLTGEHDEEDKNMISRLQDILSCLDDPSCLNADEDHSPLRQWVEACERAEGGLPVLFRHGKLHSSPEHQDVEGALDLPQSVKTPFVNNLKGGGCDNNQRAADNFETIDQSDSFTEVPPDSADDRNSKQIVVEGEGEDSSSNNNIVVEYEQSDMSAQGASAVVDEYEVLEDVGTGRYHESVFVVKHRQSGKIYMARCYDLLAYERDYVSTGRNDEEEMKFVTILRFITTHAFLNDVPYVTRLVEILYEPFTLGVTTITELCFSTQCMFYRRSIQSFSVPPLTQLPFMEVATDSPLQDANSSIMSTPPQSSCNHPPSRKPYNAPCTMYRSLTASAFGGNSILAVSQVVRDKKDGTAHIRVWTENATKAIVGQVAVALWHLHRNNIVHRDVKPHGIHVQVRGEPGAFLKHVELKPLHSPSESGAFFNSTATPPKRQCTLKFSASAYQ